MFDAAGRPVEVLVDDLVHVAGVQAESSSTAAG